MVGGGARLRSLQAARRSEQIPCVTRTVGRCVLRAMGSGLPHPATLPDGASGTARRSRHQGWSGGADSLLGSHRRLFQGAVGLQDIAVPCEMVLRSVPNRSALLQAASTVDKRELSV
eukprot:15462835-Alexandrium_andersonii.AAC.1